MPWPNWRVQRERYVLPLPRPRDMPMPEIQMIDVARLEAEEVAAEAELAACRMIRSHNFQIWMVD